MNLAEAIEENIRRFGWHCQYVFPTVEDPGVSFTYTIGLNDRLVPEQWPELIVVAMPAHVAQWMFMAIIERSEKLGTIPTEGEIIDDMMNLPFKFGPVSDLNVGSYLIQACYRAEVMGTLPVKALQVIWTDRELRWPDDPLFDSDLKDKALILA